MIRLPAVVSVLSVLLFASTAVAQATQPAARGGRGRGGAAPLSRVDPTPEQFAQIKSKSDELTAAVKALKAEGFDDALIAEAEVSAHFVGLTLRFPEEFFDQQAINRCISGLDAGLTRAKQIRDKNPAWTTAVGSISRAFRSRVDGTPQPYRVVVPNSYDKSKPTALYVYLHGRGDTDLGLGWLGQQGRANGELAPNDNGPTYIQLQAFGRANNSFRFAGETDVFEAIEAVRKNYNVDTNRIVFRGFSMGAAGVYQIGLRNPDLFAVLEANAGVIGNRRNMEGLSPTQRAAASTYGIMIDHAQNIANVPYVGFAGETDAQLASSTAIREALGTLGYTIEQIDPLMWKGKDIAAQFQINPGAGHAHARAGSPTRNAIDAFLEEHLKRGRVVPDRVQFVTYTTRYNRSYWVTVDGLERHFDRTMVDATRDASKANYTIKTTNVSRLLLADTGAAKAVSIDGKPVTFQSQASLAFQKTNGGWQPLVVQSELRKKQNLQGPINDAFFDSFLCITPSGQPLSPLGAAYSTNELDRFTRTFAREYRGEARTKPDSAVNDADIAGSNLILFGDPSSNIVLARIVDRLPIRWTRDSIAVSGKTYSSAEHVPVLIYPNPLNPARYVVINAGLSGGGQAGGFGDWAVLKLTKPETGNVQGETIEGGVFDESWKLGASN